MGTVEEIKEEIRDLTKGIDRLLELAKKDEAQYVISFGTAYQAWYSRAYKIVEGLAPERLDEFVGYYRSDRRRKRVDAGTYTIQDFINGFGATKDGFGKEKWNAINTVLIRVVNQSQILSALSSRVDGVLQDVRGHLFAELQDGELKAAAELLKISPRAAGALAGVVLERHLQQVAVNRNVSLGRKKATISNLNDALKQASVLDLPTWRKIQLLGDIRNLCCHQGSHEPSAEQVDELLLGVNTVVKSVF